MIQPFHRLRAGNRRESAFATSCLTTQSWQCRWKTGNRLCWGQHLPWTRCQDLYASGWNSHHQISRHRWTCHQYHYGVWSHHPVNIKRNMSLLATQPENMPCLQVQTLRLKFKTRWSRDFSGGPVAKTVLPMQWIQVQFLVRELDPTHCHQDPAQPNKWILNKTRRSHGTKMVEQHFICAHIFFFK